MLEQLLDPTGLFPVPLYGPCDVLRPAELLEPFPAVSSAEAGRARSSGLLSEESEMKRRRRELRTPAQRSTKREGQGARSERERGAREG